MERSWFPTRCGNWSGEDVFPLSTAAASRRKALTDKSTFGLSTGRRTCGLGDCASDRTRTCAPDSGDGFLHRLYIITKAQVRGSANLFNLTPGPVAYFEPSGVGQIAWEGRSPCADIERVQDQHERGLRYLKIEVTADENHLMLSTPKVVENSLAPGEVVEWTAFGIRSLDSRIAYVPVLIGAAIGFAIHLTTGILNNALMIGLGCGAGFLINLLREDKALRTENEPGGAQTRLVLTSDRLLIIGRPPLFGFTWSRIEGILQHRDIASISLTTQSEGHNHHHSTPTRKERRFLIVEHATGESWGWVVVKPQGTFRAAHI